MLVKNMTYGHFETPNQLEDLGLSGNTFHAAYADADSVPWTTKGLKITRFRIVSDPSFPAWDVSYCYGDVDGEKVVVELPFSQLPKRKWKSEIIRYAKRDGVFAKGLGIFENVSAIVA